MAPAYVLETEKLAGLGNEGLPLVAAAVSPGQLRTALVLPGCWQAVSPARWKGQGLALPMHSQSPVDSKPP